MLKTLVITSCTGEKLYHPENQLVQNDFTDSELLAKREAELSEYKTPAGKIYTGMQHLRLMEGISALRKAFGEDVVDLFIVSAGYGVISEKKEVVPYEVTFNTMNGTAIANWSTQVGIHQDLNDLVPQYPYFYLTPKQIDENGGMARIRISRADIIPEDLISITEFSEQQSQFAGLMYSLHGEMWISKLLSGDLGDDPAIAQYVDATKGAVERRVSFLRNGQTKVFTPFDPEVGYEYDSILPELVCALEKGRIITIDTTLMTEMEQFLLTTLVARVLFVLRKALKAARGDEASLKHEIRLAFGVGANGGNVGSKSLVDKLLKALDDGELPYLNNGVPVAIDTLPHINFVIEEAPSVLNPERIRFGSIFRDISRQGRKFQIGLTVISQQVTAIDQTNDRESLKMKILRLLSAVFEAKVHYGKEIISVNLLFGNVDILPANNLQTFCCFYDISFFPWRNEKFSTSIKTIERISRELAEDENHDVASASAIIRETLSHELDALATYLKESLDTITGPKVELFPIWEKETARVNALNECPNIVSSVRARLIQLGYIAALGSLNYVDGHYITPFAFSDISGSPSECTYVIDRKNVSKLYEKDREFRNIMQSGKFAYVDGHVVYCESDNVTYSASGARLSGWANAHIDRVSLRFSKTYDENHRYTYTFGQMNNREAAENAFKFLDLNGGMTMRERQRAANKLVEEMPDTFHSALSYIMKGRCTIDELVSRIPISRSTLLRLRTSERKQYDLDQIVIICIGLHLPPWLSEILLERAHLSVKRYGQLAHYWIILDCFYMDTVQEVVDFIKDNGYEPLKLNFEAD